MSTYYLNRGEKQLLKVKSDHEWRKKKRRELRDVEKAVEKALFGSSFTPMSVMDTPETSMSLLDLVKHMRKKYSVEEWGR